MAQQIYDNTLETYEILVSTFSILDKDNKIRFFKKSFLLAKVKPDIVFGILFLTINNVNVDFIA